MSIACPYCKAALNPKGLKPGKFQPKCPKCAKPFVMVVPAEEGGTIYVQPLAAKAPEGAKPKPAAKPKPKLTDEERAALLLEGKDPADYEDAAPEPAVDANATGDFSAPEPPKPAPKPKPKPAVDPHATGDFSEPAPKPAPAPKKSAPVPKPATRRAPTRTRPATSPKPARTRKWTRTRPAISPKPTGRSSSPRRPRNRT